MVLKYYDSPFHVTESPEAASQSVFKTDLMLLVRDAIVEKGWTQTEAAEYLNITQPRVSKIMNGKIDKFTLDALFNLLEKLGFEFKFENKPKIKKYSIRIQKVAA